MPCGIFGGQEGIEDAGPGGFRNTRAHILNANLDPFLGIPSLHRDFAHGCASRCRYIGNRVRGVHDEDENYLIQFARVRRHLAVNRDHQMPLPMANAPPAAMRGTARLTLSAPDGDLFKRQRWMDAI